ncbi:MAG: ATP-grasp domain-containing protein [Paludibacteraceae bacterium]|nr:ATP-grasp domain-containing protein [Paludibacteraceae bacterium]
MKTQDLKGKKLLVLGGTALVCDIVAKAKDMGIYTIVTDWNDPSASPAKKIADEYWMESISNTTKLAQLIKENNIDGIITNYTDSYLPFYARLCESTGLPCLATEKQMEVISNKELSKKLCIKHGISVSKRYEVSSVEDIDNLTDVRYPVLTKPVDNSGQRGIYVCLDKDELKRLYTTSLQFSQSKNVMIEEYVQGDYTVMFYTIQNGVVTLSTMSDKPVIGEFVNNLPKLPQGYILPSKYVNLCKEIMLPKVQALVKDLNIQNGIIGIEAVVKDDDIFVFEMQFRLGGMKHHNFVLKENKMDLLAMLVRFAITGQFSGWDISEYDNPNFKNVYCSLNILIQPDTVSKIEGLEIALSLPQVTNFTQMMEIGESVKLPGTVQQILFKFSLVENNLHNLKQTILTIYNTLKVYNNQGENIIINPTFLDELDA